MDDGRGVFTIAHPEPSTKLKLSSIRCLLNLSKEVKVNELKLVAFVRCDIDSVATFEKWSLFLLRITETQSNLCIPHKPKALRKQPIHIYR